MGADDGFVNTSALSYEHVDFGGIEADIDAMEEFAKKLREDLRKHYFPNMAVVSDSMRTRLPAVPTTFVELANFLEVHRTVQTDTHQNVYDFASGTDRFGSAAQTISQEYAGSDAFANARVGDVNEALAQGPTPFNVKQPGTATETDGQFEVVNDA